MFGNRSIFKRISMMLVLVVSLLSFNAFVVRSEGLKLSAIPQNELPETDREFLYKLAANTWEYFLFAMDKNTGLIHDHIQIDLKGQYQRAGYTSATNVGLSLMCVLAANDLNLISPAETYALLDKILLSLESMQKSHTLFYNYFNVFNGAPDKSKFVSSLDNAWMAAGLYVVANSGFSDLEERAGKLYKVMDFSEFYDPQSMFMHTGYTEGQGQITHAQAVYWTLCSESRILSMIAIAKGNIPEKNWRKLHQVIPTDSKWLKQSSITFSNTTTGHASYTASDFTTDSVRLVPSWGGALFEFLMPGLVISEAENAPESFGENNRRAVWMQKKYCLETRDYPIWGISSCADARKEWYVYIETGDPEMGTKGYPDFGVISPHASLLGLEIDTADVMKNLRKMCRQYPLNQKYGLLDSVDVQSGRVANYYLSLDQAMIFIALDNYLGNGVVRKRFFTGTMKNNLKKLLAKESFGFQ